MTGASRGIGAATVDRLVSDGWKTIGISRTTGHDLTVPGTMWDVLTKQVNRADALVLCAGAVDPRGIRYTLPGEWASTWQLHVGQAVEALQWALSTYTFTGSVVLVGSTAGTRPSPGWSTYSVTKAALHNLGITAAAEGAERGVRVYTLAPGRCATDLRATLAPDEDPASIMQPAEVAEVIATCINDTAGVLAGQIIEVARRG